jgi:hypothetical protein
MDVGEHEFDEPFLDVKVLKHPWEAGTEDRMHGVGVVYPDEEDVGTLRKTDRPASMSFVARGEERMKGR